MKKLLIFFILFSLSNLTANPTFKPGLTPQQQYQELQKRKQFLEKQISPEINKQLEEESKNLSLRNNEENLAELKSFEQFVLNFNFIQETAECSNKNKNACLRIKEYEEMLEKLNNALQVRQAVRASKVSLEIIEKIRTKYPETFKILQEHALIQSELAKLQSK